MRYITSNNTRDAQNRILSSVQTTAGNPSATTTAYYGFTGSGDTPDIVKDANNNIIEKYLTLPGDVLVTIRPNEPTTTTKTTYSLPNLHGDIFATVNADGVLSGTYQTGPFGETQPNTTSPQPSTQTPTPNNTTAGTTYSYVGQHQKLTDNTTSPIADGIIQMGARLYLPTLGRFMQVDPVEGGTPNNYVYALNPVNQFDLTGEAIPVVVLGGLYLGGIAWAAYDYHKNPSKENGAMLAASFVPGQGMWGKAITKLPKVAQIGIRLIDKVKKIQAVRSGINFVKKVWGSMDGPTKRPQKPQNKMFDQAIKMCGFGGCRQYKRGRI